MFSEYFIDRPRFAGVISIIMILLGLLAIAVLPVSQYPEITPPQIVVSTTYPGASAQVVIDTVAVPVENQINGVENMLYMTSSSNDDGSYKLTITFNIGTDPDIAQEGAEPPEPGDVAIAGNCSAAGAGGEYPDVQHAGAFGAAFAAEHL